MDELLRNAAGTVQITLLDGNGNPADAPGAVTAAVVDSAGVAFAGSPFNAAHNATGVYAIAPGILPVLDVYTVTWNIPDGTTRTTHFEVVGGFLFSIPDLRAFDPQFADAVKFPPALIVAKRAVVQAKFEDPKITGVAFRPRGRRATLNGNSRRMLILPDVEILDVVSASIDDVALTAEELADLKLYPMGSIVRHSLGLWTSGDRNVEIVYEYGLASTPEPITEAALQYARHLLRRGPLDNERATAVFTDIGGYRLSMAGKDGPTGLPEVDAVLEQFARPEPGFA